MFVSISDAYGCGRQVLHECGGQIPSDEISSLLIVLLGSVTQQVFPDTDRGERMPKTWVGRPENVQAEAKTASGQDQREYQRLVFTAMGNLFTRAGTSVSKDSWAAVIKVRSQSLIVVDILQYDARYMMPDSSSDGFVSRTC